MDNDELLSEAIGLLDGLRNEASEALDALPDERDAERLALEARVGAFRDAVEEVGGLRWRLP